MALPMTLVVSVLMLSGVQASDIADGSKNHGFLSEYMPLRSGYSTGKFMALHLKHMEHGGRPEAPSDHNDLAEDLESQKIANKKEDKHVQKLFTNASNKLLGLSAIGVALLSFAAMVGVRMRRGMQPDIALASSGGHGIDMSMPMVPVPVNNTWGLESKGSCLRIPEQVLQGSERILAKDMHADIKSPFALWDPFGLGEAAPKAHVENFRESELQHGRAAMASVFFVFPERARPMHTAMPAETTSRRLAGLRSSRWDSEFDPRFDCGIIGFELSFVLAEAAKQAMRGKTIVGDLVIAGTDNDALQIHQFQSYVLRRVYWQGIDASGGVRRVDTESLDDPRPDGCAGYEQYLSLYSPRYHRETGPILARLDECRPIRLCEEIKEAAVLGIPGLFWVFVCMELIEYGRATGRM